MCTSLLYFDAQNRAYLGRTLELSIDLPYQVSVFPAGLAMASAVEGCKPVTWMSSHHFVAVTMPSAVPREDTPFTSEGLKVLEGLNGAGLTFSVQSYPQAAGEDGIPDGETVALSAADLGAWVLGQFETVEEVKAAIVSQPVALERVPILGGLRMPFHFAVHDARGKSIVIEFHHGARTVYDNPVGVMTNAPQFSWHLTNLNNYTFLDNIDRSKANFGSYAAQQSGAGIAKAGLPASDTSVDRFVRAAFYAEFAEKQAEPDRAVQMVAHIMNNFDRPRGIAVDYPDQGSSHLQVQGQVSEEIATEFTTWTSLSDLDRKLFFLRDSGGMNYTRLDVGALAQTPEFRSRPMAQMLAGMKDVTASFA